MSRPLISVVIPVYKSEDIVDTLLQRLEKALQGIDYEIILVNDCSPDGTWEKIKRQAQVVPRLKALHLRKNFGYDNAILAGLNHSSGSYVVIMDDDLQHAPEDIPLLLGEVQKGHDVVYADFNTQTKKQTPFKNFGSWVNGKIAEYILNKPPHIYLSPFKIMSRDLVLEIVRYRGPYPYVDGLVFQNTTFITQIALPHYARFSGKGNFGLVRSLKVVASFCTSHSLFPLRVGVLLGFVCSILGLIFGLIVLYLRFFGSAVVIEGWASTIFVGLFLGGVQLICLGIIGEYVGRTYMNANENPQYSIREKIRLD